MVGGSTWSRIARRTEDRFDGAGSAKQMADRGLRRRHRDMAGSITDQALDRLELDLVAEGNRSAMGVDIVDFADRNAGAAVVLGLNVAELGCTALALLMNLRTGRWIVGQVGDGAVLGLSEGGKVQELVATPEIGEPQVTYTIAKPNFAEFLAVGDSARQPAPLAALFVMTDGLADDLLYSPDREALDKWAQLVLRNLLVSATPGQAAIGMLNWLAHYQVPSSWDDRTLVVVARQHPGAK